ncbi:substrate-binding periplasmic protein [Nitratidesulfovibrio sp. SRB-5]|uniref:substrate-binding periplasmic protein n=1 Tax=Nitratidesulfovibrio sp. SRB-5 TaxID=2872636 RepID=UPI0010280E2E|nr:transporter substrate-binding domain-containing protein [Nitratidesulfovibrio sp. SRB-5]MBZ2171442.1 transporter substrate-binding domain-containing protein [Nitratidesulfovibrio sp. SRB-5]RXF78354.1 transporter substrate-binding domain-containing protein [Desulfovibrio sp. DS-1]
MTVLFTLTVLSVPSPSTALTSDGAASPADDTRDGAYLMVNTVYPPYAMELADGSVGGTATTLAEELFRRLSLPVRQRLLPWNRVLRMTEDGAADGVSLLAHAPERDATMAFSVPVAEAHQSFYYASPTHDGFAWQHYEDLRPYRIGLVQGYTYSPEFLAAVQRLDLAVEYSPSDESNFAKLRSGRVDLCLSNDLVAESYLNSQQHLRSAVGKAERPVRSYPLYMAFSRSSPLAGRLAEIDAEIGRMHEDGTLQRIMDSGTVQPR